MGKFVVTIRKNGEYQFNLKATNGQVILTSEGYTTKAACLNGIESVRKNAPIEDRFEIKEAKNGKPFFNLKASNGQVIGASQMYASERTMKQGIASVMRNAPESPVVEDLGE
ncbi:MAG: YegP family protein [Bacteroidales bacterium]|nr:YegP family protein [Bacteroidales bacterium]